MGRVWAVAVCLLLFASSQVSAEAFRVRGIKGLWWEGIEKYQEALPWLAEHDLNLLMLCYSSFPASGMDWRADYTPAEQRQFAELALQGRKLGVEVCLSFNPGIWSKPPLVYSSDQDLQLALNKVKMVHGLGVNWFALCLDDINRQLEPADIAKFGNLQNAQVYFVNRLWNEMKTLKPRPKLIFCPSAYTTRDAREHMDYITTVGKGIDKGVMMFWTGPEVCSPSITAADAREFGKWIGRKPFVWDNFPVNDMYQWRLLMSPLKNRSADLAEATSGYISNPMKQWHASAIPLVTTAAYLNNPAGYDPTKAVYDIIKACPADQQRAVGMLFDIYGLSFWGEESFPPQPRPKDRAEAKKLLARYELLRKELTSCAALADLWADVQPCLEGDIRVLERKSRDRLVESPLKAMGDDFAGGAGDLYGYFLGGRAVNYVYAKPTGRDKMSAEFRLGKLPAASAKLRLVGRNGDTGVLSRVNISMNDHPVVDAKTLFDSTGFSTVELELPLAALREGSNILSICNLEENGSLGMPPWLQIAEAEIVLP